MAYTTPRTWVDGELVTASLMNTHVSDNFTSMGPHLIARKTSDQTDSVGTLQNDDHLLTPSIAANEVWWVRMASVGHQRRWSYGFRDDVSQWDIRWGQVSGTTGDRFISGTSSPLSVTTVDSNSAVAGITYV